jgi:DNA polymerase I
VNGNRLLLLDGHSIAYRAFYALPVENFSTTTGQPTNAVYGFTSMLINLLRDEQPTHLAVAFDISRKTFRSERFEGYKATRAATPDAFRGQVDLIKEVLEAMDIVALEAVGFEADDVIATLATQASASGYEVLICTGDRDTYQLVDDHITVLYPKKGVSELARMTPEAVVEKYGLTPSQYPDFAALRGDPSDNLPGIPGVGEKTATKWILEYGGLAGLVAKADQVPGKVGEALRSHLDTVLLNRELTQLIRDVSLPLSPDELLRPAFDGEKIDRIFDALQFRVLRERIAPMVTGGAPPLLETTAEVIDQIAVGDLGKWLTEHASQGAGLAFAGEWGAGRGEITGIAWATPSDRHLFVDPRALSPDDDHALRVWLADPVIPKTAHDVKGPMLALSSMGMEIQGIASDTALAAYLVLPGQRSLALEDLTERFLGRSLSKDESIDKEPTFDFDHNAGRGDELVSRARVTVDLSEFLDRTMKEREIDRLFVEVELPLVPLLARMEVTGIAVDVERLASLEAYFAAEIKRAAESAYAEVGHEFNLGSPKQLQTVLFDELGLPKTKKIKTGYTTDAESLQALMAGPNPHPVLKSLLRHRDVSKLRTTIDGLQRSIASDDRIHTSFQQTVAATGRLSSTDPNLQNIPVRTEEGRQIRECFIVGPGFETLMTADYSQIEMRIMAHLSADEGLLQAFATGEDLHTTVAAQVFGVAPGDVDPEMRRRIKAMSYGLAYGLSSYGLSQQLGISDGEARELMENYFERFGGVRSYLRTVVEDARAVGYTQTVMGRRRYLPDLSSDNRQRREMAERMALNAPIQGSAADIVKVAMLRTDAALREAKLKTRILLQVHDELVLEVAPGERDRVEELVRAEMGSAFPLAAPLDVSVGCGRTWHDAAH